MATISLNSDWLRLVEMQCDITTGEYSAFLEFDTINGEATRITVPRQLGSAPPKVLTEMIRRGARRLHRHLDGLYLDELAIAQGEGKDVLKAIKGDALQDFRVARREGRI